MKIADSHFCSSTYNSMIERSNGGRVTDRMTGRAVYSTNFLWLHGSVSHRALRIHPVLNVVLGSIFNFIILLIYKEFELIHENMSSDCHVVVLIQWDPKKPISIDMLLCDVGVRGQMSKVTDRNQSGLRLSGQIDQINLLFSSSSFYSFLVLGDLMDGCNSWKQVNGWWQISCTFFSFSFYLHYLISLTFRCSTVVQVVRQLCSCILCVWLDYFIFPDSLTQITRTPPFPPLQTAHSLVL